MTHLGGADLALSHALALEVQVVGEVLHAARLGRVLAAHPVVGEGAGAICHGAAARKVGAARRQPLLVVQRLS